MFPLSIPLCRRAACTTFSLSHKQPATPCLLKEGEHFDTPGHRDAPAVKGVENDEKKKKSAVQHPVLTAGAVAFYDIAAQSHRTGNLSVVF